MIDLAEISQSVLQYNPHADVSLLEKAYIFSKQVHEGQKRASGEPYVIHPIEVAVILTEMKLDVPSIVAGLLHDTVEDTTITLDDIQSKFGLEVSQLVDGVTKLGKIRFGSTQEKQAENFRKMIMAMSQDIRVLLIKLADRLNNMRTLDFLSEDRRIKIAKETLEIYAPLANRLGIQWMKIELEDLSFKYLKPTVFAEITAKMGNLQDQSQSYIKQVIEVLNSKINQYQISHEISGRLKHAYSIYRKMQGQNISFEQVNDLMAFRIIVDDIRECYAALGVIHELWTPIPGRFKDYIAMPKANHYQSLHTTVICIEGARAEFQIRTRKMHEIAEKGIAAHWNYKEDGSIDEKDQHKFQWVRDLLNWQKELKDPAEFLDTIKLDLFASDVYVFTPKGEVKELPHGSTPVDFAYSIHSDVGNRCVGARVNEKMVPLSYRLRSGDTVEVMTQTQHKPSKDWLKFAVSSRAKSRIRSFIRQEQRDRSVAIGKELIEKEFEKLTLAPSKYLKKEFIDPLLEEMGFQSFDTLAMRVGYGRINPVTVVSRLVPKNILDEIQKAAPPTQSNDNIISRIFKKVKERRRSIVKVGGYDDIMVTLGRCCAPLPGDSIVGFITRGRGVTVHNLDCTKAMEMDPERKVEVVWDEKNEIAHHAKLKVVSADRPGLLASMTKVISNDGVNISQASIRTTGDQKAINIFEVEIKNTEQLKGVMRALERLGGIINVERIRG